VPLYRLGIGATLLLTIPLPHAILFPCVKEAQRRDIPHVRQTAKTHAGHYPIFIPLTNIPLTSFPFSNSASFRVFCGQNPAFPSLVSWLNLYSHPRSSAPPMVAFFPHKTRMIHPNPASSTLPRHAPPSDNREQVAAPKQ
jgi:hypothetical protein